MLLLNLYKRGKEENMDVDFEYLIGIGSQMMI
jgi:hypothetical protein